MAQGQWGHGQPQVQFHPASSKTILKNTSRAMLIWSERKRTNIHSPEICHDDQDHFFAVEYM